MTGRWVEPDVRDQVVNRVLYLKNNSHLSLSDLIKFLGIARCKFYAWKDRYGKANRHNGKMPKRHWLTPEEVKTIVDYARKKVPDGSFFLKDGYRRLTYMMIDEDVAAASPATVYRILKKEGLLNRWNTRRKGSKGSGYNQPAKPHQEWHTDIKYVNYRGTFLFLISVMDGYSRYILHHELRANMTEYDVEITVQKALEKYPGHSARLISDNGSKYISKDFQVFLKETELQHIRTSVAYPQANGKIERFHRSLEEECLRKTSMIDMQDARSQVAGYIAKYNCQRLHSSLYYLTPEDFLEGRVREKLDIREKKLDKATEDRVNYWESKKTIA